MTPIKLYNSSRTGAVRYWQVSRDKHILTFEHGQENTINPVITTWKGSVKNAGRANEVSAEQDAQNEMERSVLAKERKGYSLTHPSLVKSANVMDCPEKLRFYKPLAKITPQAEKMIVEGNPIITRKYDGEMMIIKVDNRWADDAKTEWVSNVQIFSRTMLPTHHVDKKSWNERFPQIVATFSDLEGQHIFTGEMVKELQGKDDRKHVARVLKSKTEKAIEVQKQDGWLKYVIWDWPVIYGKKNTDVYESRLSAIDDLATQLTDFWVGSPDVIYGPDNLSRAKDAASFIESLKQESEYLGWEGFILADGDDNYADKIYNFRGKTDRPKTFCKIKPIYEDDFVAFWNPEEGQGTYGKGRHDGLFGSAALYQYNSKGDPIYICDCGGGFDDDFRQTAKKEDFPCVMQIKYEARTYTKNGADTNALQFPRMMHIRVDKQIEECINENL